MLRLTTERERAALRSGGRALAGDRLRAALRQRAGGPEAIDLAPRSAHEVLTRAMVDELREDLAEIRGRVNGLLFAVVVAVVVNVVMRLAGGS